MRNILRSTIVIATSLLVVVTISLFIVFAQQSSADLTGNWAVHNVKENEGTAISTYFNLKQDGGKITGTIRATQFFYTIKESTGGPEGFTIVGAMMDGKNERKVQYEGKLVGDELRIG